MNSHHVLWIALLLACATTSLAGAVSDVYGTGSQQPMTLPLPPKALGFEGLTDADFLPFQNFRYQGMRHFAKDAEGLRTVASLGMVHWTHRYNLVRGKEPERPHLSAFDRAKSRRYSVLDSLNGRTRFAFAEDPRQFQEQLVRRLESPNTRQLSFAIRSGKGKRQRHLFIYRAERDSSGLWTCTFYDPHLPADSPLRINGKLMFDPGSLGYAGEGGAIRGPPKPGIRDGGFYVSTAWARAANPRTPRAWPEEGERKTIDAEAEDAFTASIPKEDALFYTRIEARQLGVADASSTLSWQIDKKQRSLNYHPLQEEDYKSGPFDSTEGYRHFPASVPVYFLGIAESEAEFAMTMAALRGNFLPVLKWLGTRAIQWVVYKSGNWVYLMIKDPEGKLTEEERFELEEYAQGKIDEIGRKARRYYRLAERAKIAVKAGLVVARTFGEARSQTEDNQGYNKNLELLGTSENPQGLLEEADDDGERPGPSGLLGGPDDDDSETPTPQARISLESGQRRNERPSRTHTPSTQRDPHYIPRDRSGQPVPLPQQKVNNVDIPLPDPSAEGAHTTLGGRIGGDGVVYRQSATFPEHSWPEADGKVVPMSRVDWTDHGRPADHPSPHQHPFVYNGEQQRWESGGPLPVPNK